MSDLARTVEALLFLSAEPVTEMELLAACECSEEDLASALAELTEAFAPGQRGLELRELAGGWTLATAGDTEAAARRLLSKPRTPPLSPAQAETLAIIAYLQPVSRPEITRIRGVSADSAASTLLERGLIEESGRSPFGAVLYRTTSLFLKLFGMTSLEDLPDVSEWDPSPEEESDLRERLLRAGEARAGTAPTTGGLDEEAAGASGDDAQAGAGEADAEDEPPIDDDEPSADDEPPIEGDAADPAAEGLTPVADAEAEEAEAAALEEAPAEGGEPPEDEASAEEPAATDERRSGGVSPFAGQSPDDDAPPETPEG